LLFTIGDAMSYDFTDVSRFSTFALLLDSSTFSAGLSAFFSDRFSTTYSAFYSLTGDFSITLDLLFVADFSTIGSSTGSGAFS
jgi:hypothetical protein